MKYYNREEITELRCDRDLADIVAMEHTDEPEEYARLCSAGVAVITGTSKNILADMRTEEDLSDYIENQLLFMRDNEDIDATEEDIHRAAVSAGWFLSRAGGFIPDVYYIELSQAEYMSREDALRGQNGRGLVYSGDACVGKYDTEEEAREALAAMPTEIRHDRYKNSYKYIRTDYSIYRTTEGTIEPSWDVFIAGSELSETD